MDRNWLRIFDTAILITMSFAGFNKFQEFQKYSKNFQKVHKSLESVCQSFEILPRRSSNFFQNIQSTYKLKCQENSKNVRKFVSSSSNARVV